MPRLPPSIRLPVTVMMSVALPKTPKVPAGAPATSVTLPPCSRNPCSSKLLMLLLVRVALVTLAASMAEPRAIILTAPPGTGPGPSPVRRLLEITTLLSVPP